MAQEEKSKGTGGSHIYLYEQGNIEIFQEYFNSLNSEDREPILKSILNYKSKTDSSNLNKSREIQEWLEQEYSKEIKKLTFKQE